MGHIDSINSFVPPVKSKGWATLPLDNRELLAHPQAYQQIRSGHFFQYPANDLLQPTQQG